jgi:membrane associated rhomboid family serine protease
MATCYRHPDRETGVSCSNCGRPICTDCMTATSVGMRCPECTKQTTQVHSVRRRSHSTTPVVTYTLIGICVLAAIGSGSLFGGSGRSQAWFDGALVAVAQGPDGLVGVAEGEYWRLITSGFLHGNAIHLLFNMWILHWLGTELEPELGHGRFLALYLASMLAGSFGALLLSPASVTVGASGAVFGLMGAAFIFQRARGIDPWQSGLGVIILLNLGLSFVFANISIGGHFGGLIGGALTALAMDRLRSDVPAMAAAAGVGLAAAVGAVVVSEREAEQAVAALLRLVA